jgi:hypothetical protein
MTITYSVEELEHSEGSSLFLVKRISTGHDLEDEDEVLEMDVVDELMTLRNSDIEAYEALCIMLTTLVERGAPMDAAIA